ncbi:MAG: SpoIIE family protein phosphatase [Planctomycetes bacterium]|nr:SpoIIE family protein phosphatase [Planctomycetota bacterium]
MPDLPLTLRSLIGPQMGAYFVRPGDTAMIGRLPHCDICLMHEGVSRRHALVSSRGGQWFITDQASSGGTFINGVKLVPHEPVPVSEGDLARISAWTFRVCIGEDAPAGMGTVDDAAAPHQRISKISSEGHTTLAGKRLRLLTQCISKLGGTSDKPSIINAVLDAVLQGTGYARAAVLCLERDAAEVKVLGSRQTRNASGAPNTFSRSLIQAAAAGQSCVLSEMQGQVSSNSICEMEIHSAVCVPVMIGGTAAVFIYLDARASEQGVERDAAEFCEAVASVLMMAWGNLQRAELERRQSELTAELDAAREVQQTVMPSPVGRTGCVEYAVVSRPGVFVAGDFFDIIDLGAGRVAVCLGDVAGHGAGSGMLMALTQAHLSALLRTTGSLEAAVAGLNMYLCSYALSGRFASLWVGVFESDGTLRYIDAGHGHWFVRMPDGSVGEDAGACGVPVGIDDQSPFPERRLQLPVGARVVLFSDGVAEQRDPNADQFGVARIRAACDGSELASEAARIFTHLEAFAGRPSLDDDATAAIVAVRGE